MSVDKQKRSRSGFQVGTLFGIPLYLDTSWLLIVALVTVANGVDWGTLYPSWPAWQAWGTGFLAALLLFASVLFHELGHSLVAQSQGTKVNSITLFLFGGIASIDEEALNSLVEEMKEILDAPVYKDTPLQDVAQRFWTALQDNQKISSKNEERLEHNLGKLKGDFLLARAVRL